MSALQRLRTRSEAGARDRGSVTIETIGMVPAFGAFIALIIVSGRVHNARIDVDAAAAQAARTITMSDDPWGAGADEAAAVARQIVREGSPTCRSMREPDIHQVTVAGAGSVGVRVEIECEVSFSEMTALPVPGSGTVDGNAIEVFDEWREGDVPPGPAPPAPAIPDDPGFTG